MNRCARVPCRVIHGLAACALLTVTFAFGARTTTNAAKPTPTLGGHLAAPVDTGFLATVYADELLARNPHLDHNPYGLLVVWQPGVAQADRDTALATAGVHTARTYPEFADITLVEASAAHLDAARAALAADIHIRSVSFDTPVTTSALTNDQFSSQQWDMGAFPGASRPAITGSSSVVVAVIDDGVEMTHPDLVGAIWTNPGEIAGDNLDNDSNGFIDDVHGWDFANNDNNPTSTGGHGTHVAGTIAATADNGIGIAGIASGVSIMPLQFIGATGSGWSSDALAALNYAVAEGVRISNNSWGGGAYEPLRAGIIAANTFPHDHLFVAAAGNDTVNTDITPAYPAAWPLDNIISVGATSSTGAIAPFSNFGPVSVDLGAPGTGIISTFTGSTYVSMSGTSMATPHVTGAAALMLSINPALTTAQLKGTLLATTHHDPRYVGFFATGGALDVTAAIAAAQPAAVGTHTVTVNRVGTGTGTITSDVGGIDCGATCSTTRTHGTSITLTATPATGSSFAGWSGSNCTGTSTCTINVDATKDVTATFAIISFVPLAAPIRLFDTRAGQRGVLEAVTDEILPYAAGEVRRYTPGGSVGAPAGSSLTVNVVAVSPTAAGFLQLYPCASTATTPPSASFLNYVAGATVANSGNVRIDQTGGICVRSSQATNVLLDTGGSLPSSSFHALDSPVRLVDSRPGQLGVLEQPGGSIGTDVAAMLIPRVPVKFVITNTSGIPNTIAAIAINIVAISPLGNGFMTVYPCTSTAAVPPTTSTVNYLGGRTIANGATVSPSADGGICVMSSQPANVLIDTTGYFPTGTFVALPAPVRLVDSRPGQLGALEQPGGSIGTDLTATLEPRLAKRFVVTNTSGIPGSVAALAINIVAVGPAGNGFITVYPCASAATTPPATSTINYLTGGTIANGAVVSPSTGGGICVMSSQRTHVLIDTTGYFPS